MRLVQILSEKPVESSWITNLTYNRADRKMTMQLSNGRSFTIPAISRSIFERWINSPSKGKFYHANIRGKYEVNRIK